MQGTTDHSRFHKGLYSPGRGYLVRLVWHVVNHLIVKNELIPITAVRKAVCVLFGAKIGRGVVMQHGINVKYPWRLEIDDHSWIGEGVWIDNLAPVRIGKHCCVSQGAYLCTGSHDWSKATFDLIARPIVLEDGAWVGANATVCPGVTLGTHSVATAGSVIVRSTSPYRIYAGVPAVETRMRVIEN